MEQHNYIQPLALNRGTIKCVECFDGGEIVSTFQHICLGTIDIEKRAELSAKLRLLIKKSIEKLTPSEQDTIQHYTNNLIQAYQSYAIDFPKIISVDTPNKKTSAGASLTPCQLHQIIYNTARLIEYGSPEEKERFFLTLRERYTQELLQASSGLIAALKSAYGE